MGRALLAILENYQINKSALKIPKVLEKYMGGLDKIELLDEKNDLILITNDDGGKAKGIKVLRSIAQKLSNDVWEFSPLSNNSGKSHSITINKKLKLIKMKIKSS